MDLQIDSPLVTKLKAAGGAQRYLTSKIQKIQLRSSSSNSFAAIM